MDTCLCTFFDQICVCRCIQDTLILCTLYMYSQLTERHTGFRTNALYDTPYRRQVFKQSRFSLLFWIMIQNNSMRQNYVLVLTRARQLQPFFQIRHRISYGDSTRLQILETVWIVRGNKVLFLGHTGVCLDSSWVFSQTTVKFFSELN